MPSRRCAIALNSSSRENTSLTGRLAARASAATWPSKCRSHFAPNPPPSSGTTMRTSASGISSVCATPARAAYGTCVEDHTVTLSPCHCAITARGSIGTPCEASETYRPFTMTSAVAIAASASPFTIVW